MSILSLRTMSRRMKLVALAALAAGAVLMAQAIDSKPASADQTPPGVQQIVVGNQLNITTNKPFYFVGEWAQICYHVPGPGYVHITDHQYGSVKTLLSGYDDGAGDCFWGQVTPPYGQECLRIQYWFPYGGSSIKQTCFSVIPVFFPF